MSRLFCDRALVLLSCSILLLVSCTRSCRDDDDEQIIRVALAFPVENIDPRYTTSHSAARVGELVYGKLVYLKEDLSVEPFMAESITALDERTYKFTLRKGLSFHNGQALTAHDVVYTFLELNTKDVSSPYAEKFTYFESVKAPNDLEVVFTLKRPYASFLIDLSGIGIVSKASCQNRSQSCRHEYNGSGPFKLKSWDKAKEAIYLEPFAGWFEGPPTTELLLRVVRDENTRLLELIGKKTDLVEGDISPQNLAEIKEQEHLELTQIPGLGYSYLAFNVRGPREDDKIGTDEHLTRLALADKKVRKAIAHAIDFDQIIDKILLGTVDRVSGLLPNSHWAKNKSLRPPHYDPALAIQLLDEAGFKGSGPNQKRFKVIIASIPNRLKQSIAQLYADYLQKVGIDAMVRVKDWGALYQDMQQGRFEIFSSNWIPVMDPDLYYWVHHSASIPAENKIGGNRHGYKNPELDRLIEEGRYTLASLKRIPIYQRIEAMLLDELPYIPLWNEKRIIVQNRKRVFGFTPSITGSLFGLRKASNKIKV